MTGQRIGYIRVSTFDQNPERQLEGVKVDRAFRALLQIVGGDKLIIPFC